jgi:hypothetical protein
MSKKKLCDEYKSNNIGFDLPINELPKKSSTVIYDYTTGDCTALRKKKFYDSLKEASADIKHYNSTRPEHYGGDGNPYEVFNVLEAWKLDKDFYLGNVIKYIARAGKKDASKEVEDLEKALVYLQRRISELKK